MDESRAAPRRETQNRAAPRKKKRVTVGGVIWGIFKVLFTILVIGVLTTALFYRTFMRYVDTVLEPQMNVDIDALKLNQSSVIYYPDKESGRWVELTKLHAEENRTMVDYRQIPDHVVKALIAIEDKRFYEHKGVDWYGTAGQIKNMLTGSEVRGASTITQQLIKNTTGNNQVTIRRKILEIFQALRAHENYSEEEILQHYFNLVYFGAGAHGIEAAAETYFGKHVEDLTVAEGAAIVGITQNPSQFNPLRSDWTRQQNRKRQLTVLEQMHEQGYLTDAEYAKAKTEKMVFVGDQDYVETEQSDEEAQGSKQELDSFFVEQVYRDVVNALVEERGYNVDMAQMLLYTGGYQIYCTMDPKIQELVEEVYADQENFNYQSEKGEMLQSGMTVIDNSTGNIVAIAGRVGEREGAFELSYATATNQCGSAIKPLSVYAPALDAGVLTAASVIDDYPITLGDEPWPVNAYGKYMGLVPIQYALKQSSNTCAVRTLGMLGNSASYAFMEEKLGFTTLDSEDITAAGALALGGLHTGVSTVEMAAAYETFANNGVYTRPRTFTEVRDSYGNIILEDKQESWVAMKETTVYTMNELLKSVMKEGTGRSARFADMTMAGKTGTTNSKRDRYFCGYTPYYTTAVWCGYPHPARINSGDANPAADAWRMVMSRIHEGLEDRDFPTTSAGMVRVTVCSRTGLLAGDNCADIRTVLVPDGLAPTLVCDAHVMVDFCTESGSRVTPYCPEETHEQHWALDLTAPNTALGFGYTRELILKPLSDAQYEEYAAQVEAGVRETIPEGYPLLAKDSEQMLGDLNYFNFCMLHLTPPEEEPGEDPDDPTGTDGEDPPDPTDPTEPTDPTGGGETGGEEPGEEGGDGGDGEPGTGTDGTGDGSGEDGGGNPFGP